MKNLLTLSFLLGIIAFSAPSKVNAQAFMPGDVVLSAGYGAPNLSKFIFRVFDGYFYTTTGYGPIHVKGEYAVSENFGLGMSVNYSNTKLTLTDGGYTYAVMYNPISFNVRGNLHFGNSEKFDPYIGLGIGYGYRKFRIESNDPAAETFVGDILDISNPLGLEGTLGGRYFFNDNIGLYAEVGPAKSIVQMGLSFKLSTGSGRY
jgi:opacity protein-like surface antigen